MPPNTVKTLRDLIYWQYASLVAESGGPDYNNHDYITDRFRQLQCGEMNWTGSIMDYLREAGHENECIFCGSRDSLSVDYLIPMNRGGQDTVDNTVLSCSRCNQSRSDLAVYEWFAMEGKKDLPGTVEGKYLKLLFDMHAQIGTLDYGSDSLNTLCDICEVGYLCNETRLTVHCLESVLRTGRRKVSENP